jgi:NAD(P)-dependent dehydrogenase (short-subunit alcohol dehydrogenase family)
LPERKSWLVNPPLRSRDRSFAKLGDRVVATTLSEFNGRLDILVINASAIGSSPMPNRLYYPLEDFRNVINTNLIAPFLLIKKALPAAIENGDGMNSGI